MGLLIAPIVSGPGCHEKSCKFDFLDKYSMMNWAI